MRFATAIPLLLALLVTATAHGQRDLKIGDSAPGLDVEKWINGADISIEPGTVYMILFFGTEDSRSGVAVSAYSNIARMLAGSGLVVFGISSDDPDDVENFVTRRRDKVTFPVGVDRRNSTQRAWINAMDRIENLPATFVVDTRARIIYASEFGKADDEEFTDILGRIIDQRYNPRLEEEAGPTLNAAKQARDRRDWRMAERHYDKVIELDDRVFAEVALDKFEMLLVDMDDRERAYEYAKTLVTERFNDDGGALGMLAEKIATDPDFTDEMRDLDFALNAAKLGRTRVNPMQEPLALSKIALVHFHRGEIEPALKNQRQAYFRAQPRYKAEMRRVLRDYQEASR